MLLEYSVDTIDEKMVPSAIELRRRVASRKLHESLAEGRIDDNQLIAIKEKSRDERQIHLKETFVISDASIKNNVSLSRADHQFQTQHQLKLLNRDVLRISRLSRSKIDTLSDLEKRIHKMRDLLREPRDPLVETMLDEEVHANINSQVDGKFGICTVCQRRILLEVLDSHIVMCERRKVERDGPAKITLESISKQQTNQQHQPIATSSSSIIAATASTSTTITSITTHSHAHDDEKEEEYIRPDVYDIQSSFIVMLNTLPPQPPRHCVVVNKGQQIISVFGLHYHHHHHHIYRHYVPHHTTIITTTLSSSVSSYHHRTIFITDTIFTIINRSDLHRLAMVTTFA